MRLDRPEAATCLEDLAALPGNRLEALRLEHWFGVNPPSWLNLQQLHDLRIA
jgi:plasmid maintenance system antidote protein VapI